MRKIVSFVHLSLDGFVASADGGLGWISLTEELFDHVEQRVQQTDTALYGRATYQMMEAYWPTAAEQPNASKHDHEHSRWYKTARKIVLSKRWRISMIQAQQSSAAIYAMRSAN